MTQNVLYQMVKQNIKGSKVANNETQSPKYEMIKIIRHNVEIMRR